MNAEVPIADSAVPPQDFLGPRRFCVEQFVGADRGIPWSDTVSNSETQGSSRVDLTNATPTAVNVPPPAKRANFHSPRKLPASDFELCQSVRERFVSTSI